MIEDISKEERKKINEYMEKCNYAKKMLETQINIMIEDFAFKQGYNPVEHIKGRIKSNESMIEKLYRHQKISQLII